MVGGVASANKLQTESEVQFVHQPGAEQGIVQLAAAFAQQSFERPIAHGASAMRREIDYTPAADFNLVGNGLQLQQLCFRCPAGGEDDDGREPVFENFRVGIERAAAAHNDTQIVPGQPIFSAAIAGIWPGPGPHG